MCLGSRCKEDVPDDDCEGTDSLFSNDDVCGGCDVFVLVVAADCCQFGAVDYYYYKLMLMEELSLHKIQSLRFE